MSLLDIFALRRLADAGELDLHLTGEPLNATIRSLAKHDKPLVEIRQDRASMTAAGAHWLRKYVTSRAEVARSTP
jgi:hypothetical protein